MIARTLQAGSTAVGGGLGVWGSGVSPGKILKLGSKILHSGHFWHWSGTAGPAATLLHCTCIHRVQQRCKNAPKAQTHPAPAISFFSIAEFRLFCCVLLRISQVKPLQI